MAVTLAVLEDGVIFAAVCEILRLYGPPVPWPGAARPLSQALAVTAARTIAFNTATPTTAVKNVLVKR